MRKQILVLLTCLTAIAAVNGQGINFFEGTLEEACEKALKENKKVFMDFYTDWCKPCKVIASYLFPDEEAGNYFNEKFVSLKIDAEKDTGPEYADEFEIQCYPTFLIIDPDKTSLARWSGGGEHQTPASFIMKLEAELAAGPEGTPEERMSREMLRRMLQQTESNDTDNTEKVVFFRGTAEDAFKKAKRENKKVFIHFHTTGCKESDEIATNVYSRTETADLLNNGFVNLRLDAKNEGAETASLYGIAEFPGFVVAGSDGELLGSWTGAELNHWRFIKTVQHNMDGVQKSDGGIDILDLGLAEGIAKAGLENKYVLLDCFTKWCGPCKIMDTEIFPLKNVGDFVNEHFIFVKRDMEIGEGPVILKKYKIEAYPTYIVLDAKGNEILRFTGYMSPQAFIDRLEEGLDL